MKPTARGSESPMLSRQSLPGRCGLFDLSSCYGDIVETLAAPILTVAAGIAEVGVGIAACIGTKGAGCGVRAYLVTNGVVGIGAGVDFGYQAYEEEFS
jgi:hypothetical protein